MVACAALYAKSKVEPYLEIIGRSNLEALTNPCSSFTHIHGNLFNASVLLLGEEHPRKLETMICIEHLTQTKIPHIIYQEGVQSGRTVHCKDIGYFSRPNRICMGWDSLAAQAMLDELYTEREVDKASDLSPEKFHEKTKEHLKKIKTVHTYRNIALARMLRTKPKDVLGVVVIGKAHLLKYNVPNYEDDLVDAASVKEELERYKDQNPYAVLAMDTPDYPAFPPF
jgi:uncharacterized iron-regulated protein